MPAPKATHSREAQLAESPVSDSTPKYVNRELSWLEFNRRVLAEAQDPTVPLLERVKFFSIFSSNLDEFFEVRVAGIKQQIESDVVNRSVDGLTATERFQAIQRRVHELVEDPALSRRFPQERIARVRLELADGACLDSGEVSPRWEATDPPSDLELLDKFRWLAGVIVVMVGTSCAAFIISAGSSTRNTRSLPSPRGRCTARSRCRRRRGRRARSCG